MFLLKIRLFLISAFLAISCSSSEKTDWQNINLTLPQGYPEITYSRTDLGFTYVGSEQKRQLIINNRIAIDIPIQPSAFGSIEVFSVNDSMLYFQEEHISYTVNFLSSEVQEVELNSDSSIVFVGEIISPNIKDLEFIPGTKVINDL